LSRRVCFLLAGVLHLGKTALPLHRSAPVPPDRQILPDASASAGLFFSGSLGAYLHSAQVANEEQFHFDAQRPHIGQQFQKKQLQVLI
jgi:hypothetical protein